LQVSGAPLLNGDVVEEARDEILFADASRNAQTLLVERARALRVGTIRDRSSPGC
jgi:hypothetical protein